MLPITCFVLVFCWVTTLAAGEPGLMSSRRAATDFPLTADPGTKWWKEAPAVSFAHGRYGERISGLETEVRSLWTSGNLYFLFSGRYDALHLKPNPDTTKDTWELWDWDVAEVFIGSDFRDINRYKEFEVSPRGEWIDLDINLNPKPPAINAKWNSAFECKARVDKARKIWYAEMKIPFRSIDSRPIKTGLEYRINLYRIHWTNKSFLAWQPVGQDWFHNPKAFGRLVLKP
jgi:hypothetical protein